uniref:Sulfotransferase family protein n=1 Tax=Candidatus Kentrum sp. UNK TaxID=2126344 RepID=A0A451AKY8_9GAMM|nr:MAG: hypothetical protein BECKUNK1418G_GA0071005_110410 [Candidatus Kentron sp. UNK]VFK72169.1 MAG: hypothetical protein BECKUNK1418H_GA0071006_109910 [Candidatus Kentron sp. UNK]
MIEHRLEARSVKFAIHASNFALTGETLERINRFWPNNRFVFLFRNPKRQFESVRTKNYWPYCHDPDLFIREYARLSALYMGYAETDPSALFMENTVLYDVGLVKRLMAELGISKIDESLIGDSVFAAEGKTGLEPALAKKLEGSVAWEMYRRMQERAFL